jgi:multidrug resistance efflux pump
MFMKFGLPLIAALALGFGVATTMLLTPKEELTLPVHQPAVTTLSGATVAGLGAVEPRSESIAIGCPLSGIVAEVHATPGQLVKKGQPLFTLDGRALRAELELQNRTLALERVKLERLRAGTRPEDLPPARHRVGAATAYLGQTQDLCQRAEKLLKNNAMSVEEVQSRRYGVRVAESALAEARAELSRLEAGTWHRDISIAEQEVARCEAAVNRVAVDLKRLTVETPMDGVVLRVNVRPGEFALAEKAAEPLILLGDRGPLRVRVQVDEEDALRIAPGQVAEGFVRGRIRQRLDLKFVRIEPQVKPKQSLSGATTERVDTRVLVVLYEIVSSPKPVYVGQQVDVFIASNEEPPPQEKHG